MQFKNEQLEERVKKLILCKGQIFGEDECLNLVYNYGQEKPKVSNYSVQCESLEGEILFADVKDIYRMVKANPGVVKFMNQ